MTCITSKPNIISKSSLFPLFFRTFSEKRERTFIMIKPEGVQRSLIGKVITRFEEKGFKLIAVKLVVPTEKILRVHYEHITSRPFFPILLKHMTTGGPAVPMIWEGENVIKASRMIIGSTDPLKSPSGTIRGDYSVHVRRNIVHGSGSVEEADREISIWFTQEDIVRWNAINDACVHEL